MLFLPRHFRCTGGLCKNSPGCDHTKTEPLHEPLVIKYSRMQSASPMRGRSLRLVPRLTLFPLRWRCSPSGPRGCRSSLVQVPCVGGVVASLAIPLFRGGCALCEFLPLAGPHCVCGHWGPLAAVGLQALPVVWIPMTCWAVPICFGWLCRRCSPRRPHLDCRGSGLAPQLLPWRSPMVLHCRPGGSRGAPASRRLGRRPGLGAAPCIEVLARLAGLVGRSVAERRMQTPTQSGSRRRCCGSPGSSWWAPGGCASPWPRAPRPVVLPSGSRRRRVLLSPVEWHGLRRQRGGTVPAGLLWWEQSCWLCWSGGLVCCSCCHGPLVSLRRSRVMETERLAVVWWRAPYQLSSEHGLLAPFVSCFSGEASAVRCGYRAHSRGWSSKPLARISRPAGPRALVTRAGPDLEGFLLAGSP